MKHPTIEICVDRLDSVQHCAAANIDRIELCAALSEGGLSPSIAFLTHARRIFPGKIMVMIRPRCGDFLYSPEEIQLMQTDIQQARDHGADGVVFGCLHSDASIDEKSTSLLLHTAHDLDVTFHRAFDHSIDLTTSLQTLIRLGIPRVLTSGGQPNVWEGATMLNQLIHQSAGRITILPGGGLTADAAADFLTTVPATELHLSARHTIPSRMTHLSPHIPMGASTSGTPSPSLASHTNNISDDTSHKVVNPTALAILRKL